MSEERQRHRPPIESVELRQCVECDRGWFFPTGFWKDVPRECAEQHVCGECLRIALWTLVRSWDDSGGPIAFMRAMAAARKVLGLPVHEHEQAVIAANEPLP
jgi:hypothetical protein